MKIADQMRGALRLRHYSLRTERSYLAWYVRFVKFHALRHPMEMGAEEVGAFLTDLAASRDLSASSQNQALNALVFLYHHVLKKPLGVLAVPRERPNHRQAGCASAGPSAQKP